MSNTAMTIMFNADNRRLIAQRAYSLVELLVTIMVIAVAAAIVTTAMSPNDKTRLAGGASMLASDIEYAQSLSLASPDDPAMIMFDPTNGQYWVARAADPATPLPLPSSNGSYLTAFGQGRASLLADVTMTTLGLTNDQMVFDEFTRLLTTTDGSITLTNPGGSIVVVVSASTGAIQIMTPVVQLAPPPPQPLPLTPKPLKVITTGKVLAPF